MKHKVHWLIDGLIEIDAQSSEDAEKIIKALATEFSEIIKVESIGETW